MVIIMDTKLLSQDRKTGKISFLLKDSTPAFANMIRRNMIEEVPTMAIEDVDFVKNSSILYDEIIAHRLGLIPLKTDLKSYNMPSECKCNGEGCAKCTLQLTLKSRKAGIVYASELKSKDPKVVPVYQNTPIVKLLKGQEIELVAKAVLGKGKEHMKWSPGLVYYKYKPEIEIKKDPKNAEEIAKKCPKNIFETKKGKLSVIKDKVNDCHLCGECAEISNGSIKLNENNTEFIFYVEPWGQLKPKEMISKAVDIFEQRLDDFANLIKKA